MAVITNPEEEEVREKVPVKRIEKKREAEAPIPGRRPDELPDGWWERTQVPRRWRPNPVMTRPPLVGSDHLGPCGFGLPDIHRNPPSLLSTNNSKLGWILNFVLPAATTCPGKTPWCERHCYGRWGHYRITRNMATYVHNYHLSLQPDFVDRMIWELTGYTRYEGAQYCRIHTLGDYYSPEYVDKWVEIVKANPDMKFWTYTRSWNVTDPDMRAALNRLRRRVNVTMYASTDEKSGPGPAGWLEAAIDETYGTTKGVIMCRHDMEGIKCRACRYCIKGEGDVVFPMQVPGRRKS